MELPFRSIILLITILLTGLSAGLFYAWSVSVIPGTQKLGDSNYLHTMQMINRAILNPLFFLVFFSSLVLLVISTFQHFEVKVAFWLILLAFFCYLAGTVVVTGLGNVPLNNQLDQLNLADLNSDQLAEFRKHYESKWNRLHQYRTFFAVLAFLLSILAVWMEKKWI